MLQADVTHQGSDVSWGGLWVNKVKGTLKRFADSLPWGRKDLPARQNKDALVEMSHHHWLRMTKGVQHYSQCSLWGPSPIHSAAAVRCSPHGSQPTRTDPTK